jgi:hypothetical protein
MGEECNTHGRGEKVYRILTRNPKRIMVINILFIIMVLLLLIKQQNNNKNYYYYYFLSCDATAPSGPGPPHSQGF